MTQDIYDKLRLNENLRKITLAFQDHQWDISVKWALGMLLLGKEWNWFVEDAKVSVGDTIVFEATDETGKFKLCIFESSVMQQIIFHEGIFPNIYFIIQSLCLYIAAMINEIFFRKR